MTSEILDKQKHLEEEKHTISLHGRIQKQFSLRSADFCILRWRRRTKCQAQLETASKGACLLLQRRQADQYPLCSYLILNHSFIYKSLTPFAAPRVNYTLTEEEIDNDLDLILKPLPFQGTRYAFPHHQTHFDNIREEALIH